MSQPKKKRFTRKRIQRGAMAPNPDSHWRDEERRETLHTHTHTHKRARGQTICTAEAENLRDSEKRGVPSALESFRLRAWPSLPDTEPNCPWRSEWFNDSQQEQIANDGEDLKLNLPLFPPRYGGVLNEARDGYGGAQSRLVGATGPSCTDGRP